MKEFKHVTDTTLFNRRQANDALGISQATFSKYFSHDAKLRDGYRGAYLNYLADLHNTCQLAIDRLSYSQRLLEQTQLEDASVIDNHDADIKYINNFDKDATALSDCDELVYKVGVESNNVFVTGASQRDIYYRYLLPLFLLWGSQNIRPNIIYIGNFSGDFDDYYCGVPTIVPTSILYLMECCDYDIFDYHMHDYCVFGDLSSYYDPLNNKPFLQLYPVELDSISGELSRRNLLNSSDDVVCGLDMVLGTMSSIGTLSRTKLIIDDRSTNCLSDEKLEAYVSKLCRRDYSFKLDVTIIGHSNSKLAWMIDNEADRYPFKVVDNVESLPIERNSRFLMDM